MLPGRYNQVSLYTALPAVQDTQLWEDLCDLEGKLGSRYLTHESEDSFWLRQGAKPHPLAEKEQEKRHQLTQRYVNVRILEEKAAAAVHASVNGEAASGVSNGSAQGGAAVERPQLEDSVKSSSSDLINLDDQEFLLDRLMPRELASKSASFELYQSRVCGMCA